MTKTVLTVDDSRTMRDMLLLALEGAGYTVIQAVDGVDGLETLAAKGADVVITDMRLPDGLGIELIQRLAKLLVFAQALGPKRAEMFGGELGHWGELDLFPGVDRVPRR